MIRYFRRIRYELMEKNKTGKYLKYAIGEILLVVIGILIALWINNYNQEKINHKRTLGYLKSLTEDLKSDIIQYDEVIKGYKTDKTNNSRILSNDDYKNLNIDSISILVSGFWQMFGLSDQTYQKIKNAGFLEQLGSLEINQRINDYYNIDVSRYEELLEWDREYTELDSKYWMHNPNFEYSSVRKYNDIKSLPYKDSSEKRKQDLIKLIDATEGRNYLRNALERDQYAINTLKEIKVRVENLLELINQEIDK